MTLAKVYVPPQDLGEGRLALDGDDHHHLARVLRMRPGERVVVLDGRGGVGAARIVEMTRSLTTLHIASITRREEERPRLHLFQALPAGRKMETVLQAGVELGAHAIVPFASRRSRELKADAARVERWNKLALESSRLAGRAFLPVIEEPASWERALEMLGSLDAVLYADEAGGERPGEALGGRAPCDLALVVGPEGGFTDDERGLLAALGASAVTLGGNILRTETAGLVLLAAARCHYGLL